MYLSTSCRGRVDRGPSTIMSRSLSGSIKCSAFTASRTSNVASVLLSGNSLFAQVLYSCKSLKE